MMQNYAFSSYYTIVEWLQFDLILTLLDLPDLQATDDGTPFLILTEIGASINPVNIVISPGSYTVSQYITQDFIDPAWFKHLQIKFQSICTLTSIVF